MVKARERMRKLGLQLSKVKKLASDWFKESVPFWRHNSSKSYTEVHIYRKFHTYMPNLKILISNGLVKGASMEK